MDRSPTRDSSFRAVALAALLIPILLAGLPGLAAEPDRAPDSRDRETIGGEPDDQESMPEGQPTVRRGELVSVFGGDLVVPRNVEQRGMIVCIGCDAVVHGRAGEDVVVVLGSLELTGTVRGSVVGVLSSLRIDGARIGDQLINILGPMEKTGTDVDGQVVNIGFGPEFLGEAGGVLRHLAFWFRLAKIFVVFIVMLLLVALVPERIQSIAEETPVRYATAFFVGLLGYLGMLVVVSLLALTVIGLPVGILVFQVLKWLGMAGIFLALGTRFGRSFGREMSLMGAVLIGFSVYAVLVFVPSLLGGLLSVCVFSILWMFVWLFIEVPAVGMVILTRAGRPSPPPAVLPSPVISPSAPPEGFAD